MKASHTRGIPSGKPEMYYCPWCGVAKEFYYRTAGKLYQMEGCTMDREACETWAALRALATEPKPAVWVDLGGGKYVRGYR